jgi:hypothetical protein
MTMIRKQLFIDRDKSQQLQRIAAGKDLSEAELIRAGVDRILAEQRAQAKPEGWKHRFLETMASLADMSAVADRVEANKKEQGKLWQKRLARSEKQLRGD